MLTYCAFTVRRGSTRNGKRRTNEIEPFWPHGECAVDISTRKGMQNRWMHQQEAGIIVYRGSSLRRHCAWIPKPRQIWLQLRRETRCMEILWWRLGIYSWKVVETAFTWSSRPPLIICIVLKHVSEKVHLVVSEQCPWPGKFSRIKQIPVK